MPNTNVIVQARMGSTRLPGKVMKILAGQPVLWHVLQRCKLAQSIDQVIVATTKNTEDDLIVQSCQAWNFPFFRGSAEDVLSRYVETADNYHSDRIIRVTSDCPLIDPEIIDLTIDTLDGLDYVANVFERSYPHGLDCEAMSFSALRLAADTATSTFDREHVTAFFREHAGSPFRVKTVTMPRKFQAPELRLTLDTSEDFQLFTTIYDHFYHPGAIVPTVEVIDWLRTHPAVATLNTHVPQKPDRDPKLDSKELL